MQNRSNQLETIKNDFFLRGESVADWARTHEFPSQLVYAVLSGRCKGARGESHRIAVKLGLKPVTPATSNENHSIQEAGKR